MRRGGRSPSPPSGAIAFAFEARRPLKICSSLKKENKLSIWLKGSALLGGVALTASLLASELPRTVAPEGAEVYFISPADGDTVSSPVLVRFGLKGMGVAPAGVQMPNTGHHHLAVNHETPSLDQPISNDILHFGGGQTETTRELEGGFGLAAAEMENVVADGLIERRCLVVDRKVVVAGIGHLHTRRCHPHALEAKAHQHRTADGVAVSGADEVHLGPFRGDGARQLACQQGCGECDTTQQCAAFQPYGQLVLLLQ